MSKFRNIIALLSIVALVTACTCITPFKVTSIQRSDKKLTCKDVILEINEAEHYREEAAKERGVGIGEVLMPICWLTGYVDGEQGIKSANARIEYLGNIYDLLDCGGRTESGNMPPPPPVAAMPAPLPPAPKANPSSSSANININVNGVDESDIESSAPPAELPSDGDNDPDSAMKYMHEHTDRFGNKYVHSHPFTGPHTHAEDER